MPPLPATLTDIAEQLRALSNNGLQFSDDPYQIERYEKILKLSARLLALVEARPLDEIERLFFDDIDFKTALAAADTGVFDDDGRLLLIQRADDQSWAMPGGACDIGEAPASSAAREVWEESGYIVRISALVGVFDSRHCGTRSSRQLYHFLFAGKVESGEATTSHETLAVRWFATDDIPWPSLHPGHDVRIRHLLAWLDTPSQPAFFDDEGWLPDDRKTTDDLA